MLPAASRLTRSQDFGLVVRRGRRAGRSRLVVHVVRPKAPARGDRTATAERRGRSGESRPEPDDATPTWEQSSPTQVGFVVSKAVGNAVVRHRVTRQLRHLVRDRLPLLPAGTLVVVRALPPAAQASSRELGLDLDAALRKLRVLETTDERTSTERT